MTDQEYQEYLVKEITEFSGKENLKKAASILSKNILPVNRYGIDEYNNTSYFIVKDEKRSYDVYIYIRNKELSNARCSCRDFMRNDRCKHIAACLSHYGDQLLPKPPTKEEISESILKLFKSSCFSHE